MTKNFSGADTTVEFTHRFMRIVDELTRYWGMRPDVILTSEQRWSYEPIQGYALRPRTSQSGQFECDRVEITQAGVRIA